MACTHSRRYEVFLREAASTLSDAALRHHCCARRIIGASAPCLTARVAGALIVWLAERSAIFAEEPVQFSVNLSASSLADPNFLRFVELCIAKAGIAPALIAFEVDQSFWRKDRVALQRLSQGIEAIGAGLVIDNGSLHVDSAELRAGVFRACAW